jgi:hypothetical protein
MTKTQAIAIAFLVLLSSVVVVALGRKTVTAPKEETLLGPVSCTVAVAKAATQNPGVPGALQGPATNGAQNPGANAPQGPAAAGTQPKPISTVKDCLANGGQVVMLPDGARNPVPIENPDAVKGHEWHRLSISGYMLGGAFHVTSLRVI